MDRKKIVAGVLSILMLLSGCGSAEQTTPVVPQETPALEAHQQENQTAQEQAAEESREASQKSEQFVEHVGVENAEADESEISTESHDAAGSESLEETDETEKPAEPKESEELETEKDDIALLEEETIALQASPAAVPAVLKAVASGTLVKKDANAVIDYSNTADGYVMVQYTAQTTKRLKAQVAGPSTTYTYNMTPGKWEVFPLSDGNGSYKITVYENASDSKYAAVTSVTHSVTMKDEFAVFLYPNQYVDYAVATETIKKAAELTANTEDTLQKVKAVYEYVVSTLTYDQKKAASIQSGYLPVLDTVLAEKRGICFDYAALMAGMLRSQGIPSKLVVGYAGQAYHAWISVWTEEDGWLDSVIYFDGISWKRMDPTFASSGKQSASIMTYIGDGKNYTEKYFY